MKILMLFIKNLETYREFGTKLGLSQELTLIIYGKPLSITLKFFMIFFILIENYAI